jgi:hypothetical protein
VAVKFSINIDGPVLFRFVVQNCDVDWLHVMCDASDSDFLEVFLYFPGEKWTILLFTLSKLSALDRVFKPHPANALEEINSQTSVSVSETRLWNIPRAARTREDNPWSQ